MSFGNKNINSFIDIFFIIQNVKARAIPCPHQPLTRTDNKVSVAQSGTATPGATKQLLPPDKVFKRIIYIYTPNQLKAEIHLRSSFSVQFMVFKNAFTFGRWSHYALSVTVSWCYVITREWWFCVHFIHAEDFSLSTKSYLMHTAPWSEDDLRQLSNCCQWFLFLKEEKWLSVPENHDNQPQ